MQTNRFESHCFRLLGKIQGGFRKFGKEGVPGAKSSICRWQRKERGKSRKTRKEEEGTWFELEIKIDLR